MLLSSIRTVDDMVEAFSDEARCRRILEAMVWPDGRIFPGLRLQALHRDCRAGHGQLPIATGPVPMLQRRLPFPIHRDDAYAPACYQTAPEHLAQGDVAHAAIGQGIVFGAPGAGIGRQPTDGLAHGARPAPDGARTAHDGGHGGNRSLLFWRRAREQTLRGCAFRKRSQKTRKTPVLAMVQRPDGTGPGTSAGDARAAVVSGLSHRDTERVIEPRITPGASLVSDAWTAFTTIGDCFAGHESVNHSQGEYVRGAVHINSAEGFNSRVQRTIAGVFHHISPKHADLYFNEVGFRWSQRVATGTSTRKTKKRAPSHPNTLVPSFAGPATAQCLSHHRRTTDAKKFKRQHYHQIRYCCLWVINAAKSM